MIVEKYQLPIGKDDSFFPMSPERYAELWPQYVLRLEDVFLGPNGAIYDKNFELIPEANYNYTYWNKSVPTPQSPLDSCREIYLKPERPIPSAIKELPAGPNYIYAHCYFNIYVYGHLHDNLQDLSKIENLNIKNDVLITPPLTSHVNHLDHHLTLFGYPKNKRVGLSLGENSQFLHKVPTLYYPSPTAYPSCVSKAGLGFLKKKYQKLGRSEPQLSKLYLSRPQNNRSVINDSGVVRLLKSLGFTILKGDESLEKHVGLFRGADLIVGAHGALFKNIIFCENNPRILEFYAHNRSNQCFLGIASTAGIKDHHFLEERGDASHNINLNLSKIKSLI